ncbi:hypothetical protein [uncultured Jatrophihabitans sp.]|uniref:hypothetical protein n=1 Tax=uncultured Jatrophihabitans sp. TaxID=1610747 RepID=UPI0035C9E1F7
MTIMWEAEAADGRLEELIDYVRTAADPSADVYRSRDGRVVVIDPTGRGLDDVPPELLARSPHAWPFERVHR